MLTEFLNIILLKVWSSKAMPWFRRLVTGLSPWRPRFDSRSVHAKFVVDEVALGKGFLRILPFSPVSIIKLMSLDILHLHVATVQKEKRAKPRKRPKNSAVAKVGKHWIGKYLKYFMVLKG